MPSFQFLNEMWFGVTTHFLENEYGLAIEVFIHVVFMVTGFKTSKCPIPFVITAIDNLGETRLASLPTSQVLIDTKIASRRILLFDSIH